MTLTLAQLEEARRALDAPLFGNMAGDAHVSFEFFPPKSEKMEETLWRSEEHTSELQSLMRISYAVFCLKKKKKSNIINKLKRISILFTDNNKIINFMTPKSIISIQHQ